MKKKAYIDEAISIKKSIVQIKNSDNLCLVRAVLVAFSSACKTSIDEYRKIKDAHPTLSPADILIQFEKCPPWYWKHIRDNTKKNKTISPTLSVIRWVYPKINHYLMHSFRD